MSITPEQLIKKFQYALDNNWGYILGKAGGEWTQKDQDNTKNEMAIKYGQQWVGHKVADCSGLFSWAFKQLGGKMYHGSNTMWKKWCTTKGTLTEEAMTKILPGTAVFKVRDDDYYHTGLYIGDKTIIEAKSTLYGVTTSKLSQWHCWGELKGVDYPTVGAVPDPIEDDKTDVTSTVGNYRVIKWGMQGDDVKLMQQMLINRGYVLSATGKYASRTLKAITAFQEANGLKVDGIVGKRTWNKLLS